MPKRPKSAASVEEFLTDPDVLPPSPLSGKPFKASIVAVAEGNIIGVVTSGSWSPSLGHAIALGYVPPAMARPGTDLLVQVRGQQVAARVVRRPFYRRG